MLLSILPPLINSTISALSDTLYTVKVEVSSGQQKMVVNNVEVLSSNSQETFVSNVSLALFANKSRTTVDGYTNAKIYYVKIIENAILIRNFIPCYRKQDNKPGLYDLVNDVFYTNANLSATQDFIVGPDVN